MENKSPYKVNDLTKGAIFIALMAIGANIAAIIPVGPVPITFQTVIAILAGILLGKRLGTFAMVGYVLIGLIGVPVFAGFTGGVHTIGLPTFGFIISFIVATYTVGSIIAQDKSPSLLKLYIACYAGLIINYLIGVPYLYFHSHLILGLENVQFSPIVLGMAPFFVKDLILATFTAILAPQIIKAVQRSMSVKYAS